MKRSICYIWLLVLTLPFGAKVYVALDFLIHQDQITQDHCVNINKPMMMCSGKCYLNDQLQELDGQEQESHSVLTVSTPFSLYPPSTALLDIRQLSPTEVQMSHIETSDMLPSDFFYSIFQPPELMV